MSIEWNYFKPKKLFSPKFLPSGNSCRQKLLSILFHPSILFTGLLRARAKGVLTRPRKNSSAPTPPCQNGRRTDGRGERVFFGRLVGGTLPCLTNSRVLPTLLLKTFFDICSKSEWSSQEKCPQPIAFEFVTFFRKIISWVKVGSQNQSYFWVVVVACSRRTFLISPLLPSLPHMSFNPKYVPILG